MRSCRSSDQSVGFLTLPLQPGKSLVTKLFTPPYVLAAHKERPALSSSKSDKPAENVDVLYVSYCLSEDQRWLLAVATDTTGELLETCTINIEIPNRCVGKNRQSMSFYLL